MGREATHEPDYGGWQAWGLTPNAELSRTPARCGNRGTEGIPCSLLHFPYLWLALKQHISSKGQTTALFADYYCIGRHPCSQYRQRLLSETAGSIYL